MKDKLKFYDVEHPDGSFAGTIIEEIKTKKVYDSELNLLSHIEISDTETKFIKETIK